MKTQITCSISADEVDSILAIEQFFDHNRWSEHQLKEEIDNKGNINLYLRLDSIIIGYLFCQVINDEASLLKLAIKNSNRRNGFGTQMLNTLIAKLKLCKVKKLFIEVNSHNIAAVRFYEKNKFQFLYLRKKYYDEEDALVFCHNIS